MFTAEECRLVNAYHHRLQLVRDRVVGVAHRHHTSVFIGGRPGTSKTYTVCEQLNKLDVPWIIQNARITAIGLFELLLEHPEHVVVLDDTPTLFKDKPALQILLAALDGHPSQPRVISYRSKDRDDRFEFAGGVIAISNLPLNQDPLARALASRVVMLEHEVDDAMLRAFLKQLALEGHEDLSPPECLEVLEFITAETRQSALSLDVRFYFKGLNDYRQAKCGDSVCGWRDLVRSSLLKAAQEPNVTSKAADIDRQRLLVAELVRRYPNDTRRQLEDWPYGQSTFYTRRKEAISLNLI